MKYGMTETVHSRFPSMVEPILLTTPWYSASAGLGFCSNQVVLYRLDCEIALQLFAMAA